MDRSENDRCCYEWIGREVGCGDAYLPAKACYRVLLLGSGAAAPLDSQVFASKIGFTPMQNNANALFCLASLGNHALPISSHVSAIHHVITLVRCHVEIVQDDTENARVNPEESAA